MDTATINGKKYKGSFELMIDMTLIDHQRTVPGRKKIEGYILTKKDIDFFKKCFINHNKLVVTGEIVISRIRIPFMSEFVITEMEEGINNKDQSSFQMQSSGNINLDFSGVDIETVAHIHEVLYGK